MVLVDLDKTNWMHALCTPIWGYGVALTTIIVANYYSSTYTALVELLAPNKSPSAIAADSSAHISFRTTSAANR